MMLSPLDSRKIILGTTCTAFSPELDLEKAPSCFLLNQLPCCNSPYKTLQFPFRDFFLAGLRRRLPDIMYILSFPPIARVSPLRRLWSLSSFSNGFYYLPFPGYNARAHPECPSSPAASPSPRLPPPHTQQIACGQRYFSDKDAKRSSGPPFRGHLS